MLDLLSDPSFHLLLVAAYVVGLVDPDDDPSGAAHGWEYAAGTAFWAGVILTAVLFASHGAAAGGAAVIGAWALAIAGFRRGIIAQRNTLWESCLWTMPLELIIAAERGGGMKALNKEVRETAEEPGRRRMRPRTPQAPPRASGWMGVLEFLPARGRRLTLLGIAIDTAACLVVMSALSALLR